MARRRPSPTGEEALGRGPATVGRRLRDLAVLLPLGFGLLMLPPYVRVFDQDAALAGLPLLHLYVFGVWAAAIAVAGLVARQLVRSHMEPPSEAPPSDARTSTGQMPAAATPADPPRTER